MALRLLFICALVAYARCDDIDVVCCEDEALGCYSNDYPYGHLPLPACNVNPVFELFTRHNDRDPVQLGREGIPIQWDPALRTVFIIHGYLSDENMKWSKTMRQKFINKEDINVVVVGWGGGADSWLWNYEKSASNTRVVARETAMIIDNLVNNGGMDRSNVWCVGHSLGAHTCGITGMETPIGRVTGLDPAGPEWDDGDPIAGINPTSADFVDCIHTDGKSLIFPYGTMRALGHMDFYPNGGDTQPGCLTLAGEDAEIENIGVDNIQNELVACSHMRAIHLFTESIDNDCFDSCDKCESEYHIPSDCTPCEGCTIMGYGAQGSGEDGLYMLNTSTGWFWADYCERCK